MVKSTSFVWPLLIGTVIGALILFFSMKACNAPKPDIVYITDTVYRPGEIPPVPTPSEPVKPKVVIIYQDTGSIQYVEKPVYIPVPGNDPIPQKSVPTFVQGTFEGKEISLVFKDSAGYVEKKWPVEYSKYGYLFRNWSIGLEKYNLTSESKPDQPPLSLSTKKKFYTQGNIQASWSPFYNGARLYTDYSLMYKNFGIFVYGELRSYSKYADAGAGLKVTF